MASFVVTVAQRGQERRMNLVGGDALAAVRRVAPDRATGDRPYSIDPVDRFSGWPKCSSPYRAVFGSPRSRALSAQTGAEISGRFSREVRCEAVAVNTVSVAVPSAAAPSGN